MKKYWKALVAMGVVAIGLAVAAVALLFTRPVAVDEAAGQVFSARALEEVQSVRVENRHSAFTVHQAGGGFYMEELDAELVEADYLKMLLEESALVQYTEVVEETAADRSAFGLAEPEAVVEIAYTDGETLALHIGDAAPGGAGRYFAPAGDAGVYLMKENRSIRFTMPLKDYVNSVIVAPVYTDSPLGAVGRMEVGGTAVDEAIVLVPTGENEETLRQGASFGTVTHILEAPRLHGVDATAGTELMGSVTSLLSYGVYALNPSDEELTALGFDEPDYEYNFTVQFAKDGAPEPVRLRVVWHEGVPLVVRDDQPVVHIIREDEALLATEYLPLVKRWLLSPLLLDVSAVDVELDGEAYHFTVEGDTNDMAFAVNGEELDGEAFRKYYNLLVGAGTDGGLVEREPGSDALLRVTFTYRDSAKAPDTMEFYAYQPRQLAFCVNGETEFTMQESYLPAVQAATAALLAGEGFDSQY